MESKYKTGVWYWDEHTNRLEFSSTHTETVGASQLKSMITTIANQGLGYSHDNLNIKFKETIDALEKVRFRRHYRRRVNGNEPDVITIQDIRDVVIFTIPLNQINLEYVRYFHTPSMDFFLRCLIIYFQFYIQVWDYLMIRREEFKTKLHQPKVIVSENIIRDDLADLRSMVSRAYLSLLVGANDSLAFHHIKSNKNQVSQGEQDIRYIEFLFQISTRVVWIALLKRNHNLIEMEMNRMFRSESFNVIAHRQRTAPIRKQLPPGTRILKGQNAKQEYKLLQRSFVGKEMFLGKHDYRMLGIGIVEFPNMDERIRYLEIAYSAPEEYLLKKGVPVGILGYNRSEFDAMLSLRFSRNDDGTIRKFPKMVIPPVQPIREDNLLSTFPTTPPKYTKSKREIESNRNQYQIWSKYVRTQRSVFLG